MRPRTQRVEFEKIEVKATHVWKDGNGKRRQETKTFCQTVNPFNVRKDGRMKNRYQILSELIDERDTWLARRRKETSKEAESE